MAAYGNGSTGLAATHSRQAWGRMVGLGAIALAFALTCAAGKADDQYPSKPVRIVVSFSAGGPTDIVARVIGDQVVGTQGTPVEVLGKMIHHNFFPALSRTTS